MSVKKIVWLWLLLLVSRANAQLVTNNSLTPQQLVQNVLIGSGVIATNVMYTGDANGIAAFTIPTNSNLGFTNGVFLTTGTTNTTNINGPSGPASSNFSGFDQTAVGDVDLDAIIASTGKTTEDASVLEFDFTAQSDSVKFKYIFASEEYNDFVNTPFNDVFAFILSKLMTHFKCF